MKCSLVGFAVIGIGVSSALAADLPVKAPPVAPIVSTWTGCYVGANAGWIGSETPYDLAMGGAFRSSASSPFRTDDAARAALSHSYSVRESGFTGGGQLGCNFQMGSSWVFGAEGDVNGAGLSHSINATYGATTGTLASNAHSESLTTRLDWYSTVRGRVGFLVTPNLLLYGTGGVAIGHFEQDATVTFASDPAVRLQNFNFAGSASPTLTGLVYGGGAEYALPNNWTIKAEYLRLDFGSRNYSATCAATVTGCAPVASVPFVWTVYSRLREDIVRIGVNYRFNGPIVARY